MNLGSVGFSMDRASDVVCRGSICQSGVVQGVVSLAGIVVRKAYVLSVCLQNSRSLRGLLISFLALLGEFDGEEGLDAGMQVEGFAGPAGSDS